MFFIRNIIFVVLGIFIFSCDVEGNGVASLGIDLGTSEGGETSGGGSGNESNQIQITNHEELSDIRNDLYQSYILANDITIPPDYDFVPIGTFMEPFKGMLDGNNHEIIDLKIINQGSSSSPVGLFGAINAVGGQNMVSVKNLTLRNVNISSGDGTVGAVVGYLDTGTIQNVRVEGGRITAGNDYIGGLAGRVSAFGVVIGSSDVSVATDFSYVGGLVGVSDGSIKGFSTGSIAGADYVGGLVGSNGGDLIGYFQGNISGMRYIGGLAGRNDLSGDDSVIGYAVGSMRSLTNEASVGGAIGVSNGDVLMILYWDPTGTGQSRAIAENLASSTTRLTAKGFSISDVSWDSVAGVYKESVNGTVFAEPEFTQYFTVGASNVGAGAWPELK